MSRLVTSAVPLLALTGAALAADIAVTPKKLIVVDKLSTADKAKVVLVAKDPAVTKGAGEDVEQISVELDVAYENGNAAGAFAVPAGSANGWVVNKSTVAKFVNKDAPGGPTEAKVAVIKPGKLLKLVGKGLGDTDIDILGAGDPAGPVHTAFCVTNGGEENCHCSQFTGCIYKSIAGGTGAKLVCKSGTGDGACGATGSSTTTTTTVGTSTTTTLSPLVCCDDISTWCVGGWDAATCIDAGGTPVENAVCDGNGNCVSPPATGGCCCTDFMGFPAPVPYGCINISWDLTLCTESCADLGMTMVFGGVCLPDGTCAAP